MLVLLLTLGVASLSGGLALLGHTERAIASTHVRAVQTAYAAEAALHLAVETIARLPSSRRWPSEGNIAALASSAHMMAVGPGETVDLDARTEDLNREALRRWPLGAGPPRWRLMGWGRLPGPAAGALPDDSFVFRVAVWVADDVMDADGIAAEDDNGLVMIRAEAFGLGGAARAVVAHVRRVEDGVRIVSWREE